MKTEYTVDYFISFFEAIPDSLWLVRSTGGGPAHCAMGHCGALCGITRDTFPPSAKALTTLVEQHLDKPFHSYYGTGGNQLLAAINDGKDSRFLQCTPKQRVLAALNYIKSKQTPPAPLAPAVAVQHECCHIWLACGVCMICSTTKPTEQKELA